MKRIRSTLKDRMNVPSDCAGISFGMEREKFEKNKENIIKTDKEAIKNGSKSSCYIVEPDGSKTYYIINGVWQDDAKI